ncbi:hypothetical protein VAR608DRAFT_4926 [Variovorax sp. HW608]|uniref:hypothetical protein n=1 Tax=Variovorax sp. HW608 TaxID=1034889 RepID=UPI00081FC211|nr:hypothetical protein [Variovorax sp. HW608]SCK49455.1 hypothetical protein VAR608DRAFT_4926 [Variovorax sp. HW608]
MAVDASTFHLAAVLCDLSLDRLYHMTGLFGMPDHAAEIRSVDKGRLVARIVTQGIGAIESFSSGEVSVVLFACLVGMKRDGASDADLRGVLQTLQSAAKTNEVLRRAMGAAS